MLSPAIFMRLPLGWVHAILHNKPSIRPPAADGHMVHFGCLSRGKYAQTCATLWLTSLPPKGKNWTANRQRVGGFRAVAKVVNIYTVEDIT
jgi:hypothetical protein